MNFLSGLAKSAQPKPTSDEPTNADNPAEKPTSNADLFANAKVVAEAAQAQFSNDPTSYDKAKASGAAADLLDSAAEYGKLDDSQGVGKYVEQAEGYLRQYGTPAAAADGKAPPVGAAGDESEKEFSAPKTTTTGTTETTDAEKPTGGAGDYLKKAEEVVEKPSGGAGDYLKKAEEVLEKPSGGDTETGGAGAYLKKAEEVVEKPSGDGGEKKEEGGYGDLMRAAGGFLNK